MPTYSYLCNNCEKIFELFFSYTNYQEKPKCEYCKSKNTERQIALDASTINSSVKKCDSELGTIGDLANRNRDKLSNDEKVHLYNKHNAYKQEAPTTKLPKGAKRIKKSKGIKWT
jgi:putative FmdB family regulatory protein